MAGDATRAESLAQDLNKSHPLDTQMQLLWLPAIRAQLALNRKNSALALDTLRPAAPVELGEFLFVANTSCLYPPYFRGEAYLAAEEGTQAAAEFQNFLDHSGLVWNCWTGALARLGIARANALQAKPSQGADADAGYSMTNSHNGLQTERLVLIDTGRCLISVLQLRCGSPARSGRLFIGNLSPSESYSIFEEPTVVVNTPMRHRREARDEESRS